MSIRWTVVLLLCLLAALSVSAQGMEGWQPTYVDEPGICEGGQICGPSGSFTVTDFPTISPVDWSAFPANPLRPHLPADGGRTWYVAVNGSDDASGEQGAPLATIDQALELAGPGDVIQVADGEYPVGTHDDSLIMATPGVILMAEHIGGAVLRPLDEDWLWLAGIVAQADDLVIDGFIIRGFTGGGGVLFGRLDSPQRNLVLRHLWIEGAEDGIRSAIPDTSVNPQPVIQGMLLYDVAIRDSLIGFNCGEGPCDGLRLEALSVDLRGDSMVDVGSWGDAVAVENGDNIVVFNAEITGAGADGLDFKGSRVAIANVHVHDVARNGIKLWQDGDVINALVYNTGADAALVLDGGGVYRLLNSVIARHAYGGSAYAGTAAYDWPEEPGSLQIANSIFYQNAGAMWVSGAFDLSVRRTLFYGSTNSEELIWATADPLVLHDGESLPASLEAAGCCDLDFADPGFVNPDAGDYRLAPGAYAIDAGTTDGVDALPPFDLLGNPRIAGAAIDLGPYEMQE